MVKDYNISKKEAADLYITMKFVHDTFGKFKIRYWLAFGTLLGAIRHGGIIPWDDDGDICVMRADIPKLRKLETYFKNNGFILGEVKDDPDDKEKDICKKVRNSCDWYISLDKPDALGIDVFVTMFDPKNRKKINYASPYWLSDVGDKCYHYKEHVFPLVPIRFGNFYCYVPNNSIQYLNNCYGNTWNSHSQMMFNHRLGKWIKNKAKIMKNFSTIPAPRSTCSLKAPPIIPYTVRSSGCKN